MLLKKALLSGLSLVLVATLLGQSATEASIIKKGDFLRLYNTPGRTGSGGEFAVKLGGTNAGWDARSFAFRTFCCEVAENISLGNTNGTGGTTYKVGDISMKTVSGGKVLTKGAAWLFDQFWTKTNAGLLATGSVTIGGESYELGNTTTRGTDGQSLQRAIWNLMNDANGSDTKSNDLVAAAKSALGNTGAYEAVSAANTRVRILNIVGANGTGSFQDQLVVIPEPGSFLVWGVLGLAGVGLTNRRRKS